ncbi:MAG TPA: group II intron maturase-specific domain-containing protein [Anaerolineales bacterium]|nr:group II intron maturase-specific domain-containing protein [Anaerolineales bacterium]
MRGEHAGRHDEGDRGAGEDGRELVQELDRLEEQMRGAIAPDGLQRDEDASVGPELDAVLGERGAEEVAAERLEAGTIGGGDPDVGVEIEAIELGLTRAAGGDVTEGRPVAEAAGWVTYFRIGNAARCFAYVTNWVEKKVRRHLMRARNRPGFGWTRWSTVGLYEALGLFHDYRVQ